MCGCYVGNESPKRGLVVFCQKRFAPPSHGPRSGPSPGAPSRLVRALLIYMQPAGSMQDLQFGIDTGGTNGTVSWARETNA
jgi:hypothetical protein